MKLKPEELVDHGYVLLDHLSHQEIIPFVRTYLNKKTRISRFYTFSNLFIAGVLIFWFWKNYGTPNFHLGNGISYFSYGLAIAFTLIPIHEYIHVLAYKWVGAKNTSYDANLKKFYFMAIADRFVADKREFKIVALAPFAVISTVCIILLFFSGLLWTFTILGVLLTHTAFTSGDFGLLSYFEHHANKDIVTYDDKANGISYFYGKDNSGES